MQSDILKTLQAVKQEMLNDVNKVQQAIDALQETPRVGRPRGTTNRKPLSMAARRRIARAQRLRWKLERAKQEFRHKKAA